MGFFMTSLPSSVARCPRTPVSRECFTGQVAKPSWTAMKSVSRSTLFSYPGSAVPGPSLYRF